MLYAQGVFTIYHESIKNILKNFQYIFVYISAGFISMIASQIFWFS